MDFAFIAGIARLFDLSGSLSISQSSESPADDWQTIGDDLRSIMPDIDDVHSQIRDMRHTSDRY